MNEVVKYQDELQPTKVANLHIDLTAFMAAADNLFSQAERAEVTDTKTYATGGDLIKIIRNESAKVEDMRVDLAGPFNKIFKFINNACKPSKERFTDARSLIEKKMLTWKATEDARLRKIAEEEKKKLEADALERAGVEKTAEAQDEVLDAAAEAGAEIVGKSGLALQRGNYGSSTGTKKKYTTNVYNITKFIGALALMADGGEVELGSIIEFKKGGMNKLAEYMLTKRIAGKGKTDNIPGAEFVESEDIRVY